MGDFAIQCQTTVPLSSYGEPDDFVVRYDAAIQHDGAEIGEVVLYKVLLGLATNYGESTFEIFDCHSQELLEIYEALFDLDTGDIKDEIDGQFACLGFDLLIIDHIRLDPQWRGLKLGLLALRKLIDIHQSDCQLVVCQPYPPENADTPAQRRVGTVKLRRYLKQLGFRRIGRTEFYGLSTTYVMPKFEDVLRPTAADRLPHMRQP